MLQSFLQTSALAPLGRECLSAFWTVGLIIPSFANEISVLHPWRVR